MPSTAAPSAALRILLVEDQPLDAELMMLELRRSGFASAEVIRTETAEEFTRELAQSPDVILCDYALPSFSAPEALRLVQQRQLDIPFIIISGSIGEEIAVDAIKHGADDYLLKDRLGRLGPAVAQALEEKKLRAAAHRAEEDLRQSEYKYRCLFEHLPDAAYLCDSGNGRIIDVNHRGETLLGLDRASVLGKKLAQFVTPQVFHSLVEAARPPDASPHSLPAEIVRADAQRRPARILASIVPIYHRRLLLVFVRPTAAPELAPSP